MKDDRSFIGSLSVMPLVEVYRFILYKKLDGTLKLTKGNQEKSINFSHGQIIQGSSNVYYETWDTFLRHNSVKQTDEFERGLRLFRLNQKLFEANLTNRIVDLETILIEEDIYSDQELDHLRKLMLRELLFSTLMWNEGNYSFIPADLYDNGSSIKLRLDNLLFEGQILLENCGDLNNIKNLPETYIIKNSKKKPFKFSKAEQGILNFASQKIPLWNIARQINKNLLSILPLIYRLKKKEVIDLVYPEEDSRNFKNFSLPELREKLKKHYQQHRNLLVHKFLKIWQNKKSEVSTLLSLENHIKGMSLIDQYQYNPYCPFQCSTSKLSSYLSDYPQLMIETKNFFDKLNGLQRQNKEYPYILAKMDLEEHLLFLDLLRLKVIQQFTKSKR